MEVGAKGPVFDWDTIFQMLRNGRCAQTVGPRSKIFSSEKPPYWVVLTPLSNQNSADDIYGPLSKFSHSYTLKVGCKSGRKVVTHNFKSDSPLIKYVIKQEFLAGTICLKLRV